ncbi:TPA: hypothetical protein DDW35_06660 [Candidatus Sumerlaeota bacterium]|jgi:hypothetical protein|nr:hypothetical protein [Candidatus Sumerlaeota bacterium]
MKIAVSIPNTLFESAETLARQRHLTRSALYAQALTEFLKLHRSEEITAQLNQVYGKQSDGVDPALARLQSLSLPSEQW